MAVPPPFLSSDKRFTSAAQRIGSADPVAAHVRAARGLIAAGKAGRENIVIAPCLTRRRRLEHGPDHRGFGPDLAPRRGGRVVECTALEMRHRCKPIGGSNPSLSATNLIASEEALSDQALSTKAV